APIASPITGRCVDRDASRGRPVNPARRLVETGLDGDFPSVKIAPIVTRGWIDADPGRAGRRGVRSAATCRQSTHDTTAIRPSKWRRAGGPRACGRGAGVREGTGGGPPTDPR